MKKIVIFYAISFFALLAVATMVSCHGTQRNDVVFISPDNEMEASDFIENVDYIRLPKSDTCLLARIEAVKFDHEKIAVQSNRNIFIFNKGGNLLGKINRLGNGRGEYTNINDFQLSKDGIYVLSGLQKKILEYTIIGNFIREYKLDDTYHHFEFVDKGKIVLSSEQCNDSHYNFLYYDLDQEKEIFSIDEFERNEAFAVPSFNAFLGHSNDALLVGHLFDTSIYSLKKNQISKEMTFDFNTRDHISPSNKSFVELDEETRYKNVVRYLLAYTKIGTYQYLVYPLFGDSGLKTCITRIDKEGNDNTIKIGKDVDDAYPYFFMGNYLCVKDDLLVMAVDADRLLELEKENGLSHFKENGINKDDNPVLFFYTLKGN